MDTLVLEFPDEASCQATLDAVSDLYNAWALQQGYEVVNGDIVSKNYETDMNQPNAQRTVAWDVPVQSTTGTWYFSSPNNREELSSLLGQLPAELQTYTEKSSAEVIRA